YHHEDALHSDVDLNTTAQTPLHNNEVYWSAAHYTTEESYTSLRTALQNNGVVHWLLQTDGKGTGCFKLMAKAPVASKRYRCYGDIMSAPMMAMVSPV
ncbi:Hypothetical predicted protein, partial [Olea europaea subsp. europaea]